MVFLAQCHLAGVVGGDEASAIRACAPSRLPFLPLWGAGPVRYGVSLCTVRFGTVRYGGQAISRFMVLISSHHVLAVAPVRGRRAWGGGTTGPLALCLGGPRDTGKSPVPPIAGHLQLTQVRREPERTRLHWPPPAFTHRPQAWATVLSSGSRSGDCERGAA
jgi:hypothetical protein